MEDNIFVGDVAETSVTESSSESTTETMVSEAPRPTTRVNCGPPSFYDLEKARKKKELPFEDKLQKFMHESKQIQFGIKHRIEVKWAGGKKRYAKRHRRTKKAKKR